MLTPASTNLSRRRAAAHLCCLEMDCLLLGMDVDKKGKAQIIGYSQGSGEVVHVVLQMRRSEGACSSSAGGISTFVGMKLE